MKVVFVSAQYLTLIDYSHRAHARVHRRYEHFGTSSFSAIDITNCCSSFKMKVGVYVAKSKEQSSRLSTKSTESIPTRRSTPDIQMLTNGKCNMFSNVLNHCSVQRPCF